MTRKKMKIGILHYRIGLTDGVSLEISKRKKVFEKMGYQVKLISGTKQIGADFIIPELEFDRQDILKIKGLREMQFYLIKEIQKVYESQGIPINDKHFEVIVRKMCDKVRIENSGDTSFLPGELVEKSHFKEENAACLAKGGDPSTATIIVLGITRASLYTDSWLSAASFQETSNILTEASVLGKEDKLLGLKENVIIGRLIPSMIKSPTKEDKYSTKQNSKE